jgi:hypothetical protein
LIICHDAKAGAERDAGRRFQGQGQGQGQGSGGVTDLSLASCYASMQLGINSWTT